VKVVEEARRAEVLKTKTQGPQNPEMGVYEFAAMGGGGGGGNWEVQIGIGQNAVEENWEWDD